MILLIVLAVVYGIGVAVTLFISGIAYAVNRDIYDAPARNAAKWFIGSPLWPLLLVRAIFALLAQMKAELKEDA